MNLLTTPEYDEEKVKRGPPFNVLQKSAYVSSSIVRSGYVRRTSKEHGKFRSAGLV